MSTLQIGHFDFPCFTTQPEMQSRSNICKHGRVLIVAPDLKSSKHIVQFALSFGRRSGLLIREFGRSMNISFTRSEFLLLNNNDNEPPNKPDEPGGNNLLDVSNRLLDETSCRLTMPENILLPPKFPLLALLLFVLLFVFDWFDWVVELPLLFVLFRFDWVDELVFPAESFLCASILDIGFVELLGEIMEEKGLSDLPSLLLLSWKVFLVELLVERPVGK